MLRSSAGAVLLMLTALPFASVAGEMSGSRAVINLPDGRLLALTGARSQSLTSIGGRQRIVADGIVIEIDGDRVMVDSEPREMPAFETMLEVRVTGGKVELIGDP